VDNLRGWLTTVLARVCLDMLRSRRSRREEPLDPVESPAGASAPAPASALELAEPADPESALALADSVGPALQVVLEMLTPAERVAFVLHDTFDLPFEEIAPIIGRTPEAARQLASRARRRVRGEPAERPGDVDRQRRVVNAFLAASRDGDFAGLLAVLAPEVVLRADEAAVRAATANRARGVPAPALAPEVRGAEAVAEAFKGRAGAATPALIDGHPGAVWVMGGRPRVAFVFTVDGDQVTGIELVMEPARVAELDVQLEGG
jgi:RNA polymerase sigma-70 factor (ECF subfamily)